MYRSWNWRESCKPRTEASAPWCQGSPSTPGAALPADASSLAVGPVWLPEGGPCLLGSVGAQGHSLPPCRRVGESWAGGCIAAEPAGLASGRPGPGGEAAWSVAPQCRHAAGSGLLLGGSCRAVLAAACSVGCPATQTASPGVPCMSPSHWGRSQSALGLHRPLCQMQRILLSPKL